MESLKLGHSFLQQFEAKGIEAMEIGNLLTQIEEGSWPKYCIKLNVIGLEVVFKLCLMLNKQRQ